MYNYQKYLETYKYSTELPSNNQVIEFRPLTTNDMKKLLVYENQKDPLLGEDILDSIINEVVLVENFNVEDLYTQDRYFLFIELRKATKGSKFTFPYTCSGCKNQSIQSIDLNNLTVKKMEMTSEEVELLDGNIKLQMGFSTRKEQKDAYKTINKKLRPTEKQVEMVLADISCSIKAIVTSEGIEEPPIEAKMDFIGNLPASEYDKITKWYRDNDFGIDLNITIYCPDCGKEETTQVPLNNFLE